MPTHVRIIPADVSRMEMRRKMRLTLLFALEFFQIMKILWISFYCLQKLEKDHYFGMCISINLNDFVRLEGNKINKMHF